MNKQQGNTPVHIWRVDFEGLEMRITSSDGIHVWIARDDVMEALQIPDPGYALSFVTLEDQAVLSSGTDVPDEESEPDGLPMINEIAVHEIMARFPTPPTGRFKPWLLRLRHWRTKDRSMNLVARLQPVTAVLWIWVLLKFGRIVMNLVIGPECRKSRRRNTL